MLLNNVVFLRCKLARLFKHFVRNADFTDIMEDGCIFQRLILHPDAVTLFIQLDRIAAYVGRMIACVGVTFFQ